MLTDRRLRVLISGGGIAGGTLACLLGRAGHQVTVVERDGGVRCSGSPVDVRGAAFDVVDHLALVSQLRDAATMVRQLVFVDTTGQRVASMATRRSEDRELEIPRADLSAALVSAARDEVDFRFNDTIVAIQPDGPGVDVSFERAAADRFDLVVGADGLHSTVRRLVFGPESDYITDLGMYVATVRLRDALEPADTVLMHNKPGAAVALHPGTDQPIAAFMFRSSTQVNPRDTDAAKDLITSVYGDVGWRTPELVAAYLTATDTYFDTVSRVRLPTWSRGLVTLLGDAASCVSLFGEGASSAIQGAATLALSLDASPQNVPAALARYQATHQPVTNRRQRGVPIASHLLIPASRAGITLRNSTLRLARGRR